jgi:hypothetical protein
VAGFNLVGCLAHKVKQVYKVKVLFFNLVNKLMHLLVA